MTTKKNDSALSRWSQRKMLVQERKIPPKPTTEQVSEGDANLQAVSLGELSEDQIKTGEPGTDLSSGQDESDQTELDREKYENIDYEQLDYDSDYTQFMAENVPEMVKRRALRALWNSDPIFANLDGLNDYDEDFTDASVVTKGIESAWNMGKGYMTEEDEQQPDPGDHIETAQADSVNEGVMDKVTDQPDNRPSQSDQDEVEQQSDKQEEPSKSS